MVIPPPNVSGTSPMPISSTLSVTHQKSPPTSSIQGESPVENPTSKKTNSLFKSFISFFSFKKTASDATQKAAPQVKASRPEPQSQTPTTQKTSWFAFSIFGSGKPRSVVFWGPKKSESEKPAPATTQPKVPANPVVASKTAQKKGVIETSKSQATTKTSVTPKTEAFSPGSYIENPNKAITKEETEKLIDFIKKNPDKANILAENTSKIVAQMKAKDNTNEFALLAELAKNKAVLPTLVKKLNTLENLPPGISRGNLSYNILERLTQTEQTALVKTCVDLEFSNALHMDSALRTSTFAAGAVGSLQKLLLKNNSELNKKFQELFNSELIPQEKLEDTPEGIEKAINYLSKMFDIAGNILDSPDYPEQLKVIFDYYKECHYKKFKNEGEAQMFVRQPFALNFLSPLLTTPQDFISQDKLKLTQVQSKNLVFAAVRFLVLANGMSLEKAVKPYQISFLKTLYESPKDNAGRMLRKFNELSDHLKISNPVKISNPDSQ